ncbi:FKBP-type peptidyl-prolyl cis-trans isomerase [Bacteroidota bacterium]
MKKTAILVFTFIGLMIVVESAAQKGKKDRLESEIDTVSYAIGVSIGTSVKQQNLPDLNIDKISEAIEDVLNSMELKLTLEQSQMILTDYIKTIQEKLKMENMEKMASFLEENKKNPEVVVLPSGLQYMVIEEGEGQSPLPESQVITHYKGTLLDGTVFDSSYERGEPITLSVSHVIKGWQEALVLMKPGSKWKLFIPPYLGYGDRNAGSIPPNSLLIFEIELIGIE